MRKEITILLCVVMTVLFSACGVSKVEYEKVVAENKQLMNEIDELKNGADRLLLQAKNLIQKGSLEEANKVLTMLEEKHSGTIQWQDEGKKLFQRNALEIKKIDEEKTKAEKARLEKEEKERIEAAKKEKERLEKALSKMRPKHDNIENITWYSDYSTTEYSNTNSFHIYIGKEAKATPWLRLRIQYSAKDWLFINKYTIKVDNETYTIDADGKVERDNSSRIWEWYDEPIDSASYNILLKVMESNNAVIRCIGTQYHNDRIISGQEKKAIKNVLDAYDSLGGTRSF